jgi:uncharacterized membrane protein
VNTNRLESFSDGVLAVAITLLVLDITVPRATLKESLGHELAHNWPEYAAYATSFITIGIIWINHHAMISRLREADHAILILNLLLLLSIGILPFATSLMAAYLTRPQGQHLAAVVYGGSFLAMSVLFAVLNRHILLRKAHFLSTPIPEERRRKIGSRAAFGLIPYAIATALGLVSAYATLVICAGIGVYYALPRASGMERSPEPPTLTSAGG